MNRIDGRNFDQLRPVKITTGFVDYAEGSVLIECGHTKVLCCSTLAQQSTLVWPHSMRTLPSA